MEGRLWKAPVNSQIFFFSLIIISHLPKRIWGYFQQSIIPYIFFMFKKQSNEGKQRWNPCFRKLRVSTSGHNSPLDICLEVRLWNHTVILFLIFWGTSILFSVKTAQIYIPTKQYASVSSSPHPHQDLSFVFLTTAIYAYTYIKYSKIFNLKKRRKSSYLKGQEWN